jgi:hypothetical protein
VKLVYIAGALSGPTSHERRANITRASQAGAAVAGIGAMPVVPHTMTARMTTAAPEPFWYEGTAELLRRCDAVYVFDTNHVETSKGTRSEVDLAVGLGLPVFIDLGLLGIWLEMLEARSVTPLVASEPIEAGQLVALHPDGTVRPAR